MPVLSIIIPNYNSGKLLQRCLKSIVKNHADIQVVVVDDGSTDDSATIAEKIDPRVQLVRQNNQGVSAARNNGLANADGQYVMFADADDCFDPHWADYVLPALSNSSDLFLFNYYNGRKKVPIIDHSVDLIGTDFANYRLKMLENPTKFLTVWGKVLRMEVITSHQLIFNSQLRLAEDGDFMVRYLIHCQNIVTNDHYLYHYLDNEDSVMRSFDANKVADYLKAMTVTTAAVKQTHDFALIHANSFYILMHLNVMMVRDVFNIDNPEPFAQKLRRLKNTLKVPVIKTALTDVHLSECRSPRTVPILLLKMKCYRLAALAFITRSKQNHHN